ncbi:Aminopeptidase Y (Arg, Lys, Leu preference) [Alloactinosynnema sp. L-07]|uniref:M14 family zinc carboxypeptidase n=1 Tax=Alloactinosynnema sp. L-07 TaxID=1653480 RepID=UPI00065EF18C|nr:M14 family zinc carboxypeptidase [Alloactinosynnema sp. L-07]CRK59432.1 Aminopeptidase Y (Arg, Lys, Leu preference) [Alloactinosynnema sp. L-07]
MARQRRAVLAAAGAVAAAGALLLGTLPGQATPTPTAAAPGPAYVYRVHAPLGAAAQDLLGKGFDVLETRDGQDLFVAGDARVGERLRAAGFSAAVDQVVQAPQWTPPAKRWQSPSYTAADMADTYYGGYRTVNAQYAHLDSVASQYPGLATVVDYGDSWRKTQGAGGYDLRAICITKKVSGDCARTPSAAKPRLFVMGQLHAREITTGDVAYRWIDELVTGYGNNAEITSILDTTEVWVVPIANPDGVDIVQQGGNSPILQRKNANGSGCAADSNGVDLNRNTSSGYGTGSSASKCDQTYRGTAANSEVETRALQGLWKQLYPDRRDGGMTTPAPADTKGVVLSMHSYSNLVLFPWGSTTAQKTGNDAALRGMAKDMAQIAGGWGYGQPGEVLYNAGGSTDDWVYDELGVASFVWEIGGASGTCGGFVPAFSCQQSTWWPKVKPMLVYSAKKAANPYGGGTPPPPPPPGCGKKTNDTDVAIPDGGAAVTSSINVSGCAGNAPSGTPVEVHIKHTWRGDVVVDLVAPDGTAYRLKNTSSNDSADNIDTTYTVNLSSEAMNGTWNLKVQDVARYDTGSIDSWSLTF